ncbi:ATPase inhibitor, mitochondrial [Toxocara canis]|uniref:ATPase inhibitor, mitochondrial n=1 Tax=Toxocara canis TaxID=6265 RepID=A0A0B2UTT6_TOXCA|nr:ATPase inhibitor, mitochondrial [Toxocara canis]
MASGGRSEGAIREAGGAFGKLETAREEKYFRDLVKNEKQIGALKKDLDDRVKEKIAKDEPLNENERLSLEAAKQRQVLMKNDGAE